ncbi:MAG: BMP family ABC transporter substrate-binding protein [Clostridia bacterium]
MMGVAVAETYDVAMITDVGTIDDKSFNQGTWEGIVAYCEANKISHQYYKPAAKSTEAYLDSIEQAVTNGAKVIVTPGFLFEEPIYIAQDMYPEVTFVLLDGNPHNADYSEFRTEKNAVGIVFAEEQSGFLAGYAAVKEGFTKLGFMGGMAVPAVVRFGYGFVQGADQAAKELGIPEVAMNYYYTGGFDATPEAQAMAASWYADGVECIFACGGAVGNSVMAAAKAAGAKVIGVDVDQSAESETVIASAAKGLAAAVEQTLSAYYAGTFPGGQSLVLGAAQNGVTLPMPEGRMVNFTTADYDTIYAKLVSGEYAPIKDDAATAATEIKTEIVKVNLIG